MLSFQPPRRPGAGAFGFPDRPRIPIMKSPTKSVFLAVLMIAVFSAGTWLGFRTGSRQTQPAGRKILYWHDPMHPSYKSDKPGIAPDCGMQLEPVYEDGVPNAPAGESVMAPGTVHIGPEKQQLIGLRVGTVERVSGTYTVRVLGRVVTDQTRIYRLNAAVEGWVREVTSDADGSLLKKDQLLASFYAPEFLGAEQAYLYAVGAMDRFQATGKETPEQINLTNANIQSAADSLRNLGMTDIQIRELRKTRQLTQNIEIRSPANGFILTRNISLGQRFEKGTEFYRIADLERVWILADVFESDSPHFRPGARATVKHGTMQRVLSATVSNVLPQFDPATRTLKLRLEADNPGFALRPDMFVDVEIPTRLAPTLSAPSDAVIDTGLKKIAFVDRGNGYFEPRRVETGWRFGDRVEITKGLMEGERIVISGNFLVDSESRLRLAAQGLAADHAIDPVCGMAVNPHKTERKGDYRGQTYYFCSERCQAQFRDNPEQYVSQAPGARW